MIHSLEISSPKKNRIHLHDYDYETDIKNRLLLSKFEEDDVRVLEAILYSSLKTSIRKLMKNLSLTEEEISVSLEKISRTSLIEVQGDILFVDKKVRKYFDLHLLSFEEGFHPNLDFLQKSLQLLPPHILPAWYQVPRTSNNIFESIVEKYLSTPQIFERYVNDLCHQNPYLEKIIKKVFSFPFDVPFNHLLALGEFDEESLEKEILFLEYNLILSVKFVKNEKGYDKVISPFQEYKEYLQFIASTTTFPISQEEEIERVRPRDFSFIYDLSELIRFIKLQPISLEWEPHLLSLHSALNLARQLQIFSPDELLEERYIQHYLTKIVERAILLRLADEVDEKLYALEAANSWLSHSEEEKSLFCYRLPLSHQILPPSLSQNFSEKHFREAEKSIKRVKDRGWVFFDEFIKGVMIPIHESQMIPLKNQGKTWKYLFPAYSEEDCALVKYVIFDWLFSCSITAIGKLDKRDCFCVTFFGRKIFED